MTNGSRPAVVIAPLVFAALLAVYTASDAPLPTWDQYANVFPALSLLNDGDLAIAPTEIPFLFVWRLSVSGRRVQVPVWDRMIIEGRPADELHKAGALRVEKEAFYFLIRAPGGEWVGTEPPGAAVAIAPFLKVVTLPDTAASLRNVVPLLARVHHVAAIFIAATAAILFLTSLRYLSPPRALLVAAIFGLGTCAWSLGSQAFWAQTAMQPFLALGIDQFLRIRDRRGHAVVAGLALGLAVSCRSTALLVLAAVGIHLLVADRKALLLCVAGALPPLALLAAYNAHYFGSPFVEAHALMGPAIARAKTGSPALWSASPWAGALGLLISPGRGLFVYSPILALSFVGAHRVLRARAPRELLPIVAAAALVMLLRFTWFDWWGGYSYGYRPLMDAIVPLAVLLIPAFATPCRTALARVAVAVLLAWSAGVQWVGTAYDAETWDRFGSPDRRVVRSIDDPRHRARLWSVRDNPIAFYFRHRDAALARRAASLHALTHGPVEVRRTAE